jgi:hypothetical protein
MSSRRRRVASPGGLGNRLLVAVVVVVVVVVIVEGATAWVVVAGTGRLTMRRQRIAVDQRLADATAPTADRERAWRSPRPSPKRTTA